MNIEQKNRLIALCNNMKSYGYTDGVEELESIFPQLRESEDDRIRKELLEYLTVTHQQDFVAHPERQRWIAYLEKQKALSELGKYIAAERTKPGFMFAGNDSVSWEELPLDIRKHDYPYYFIGDLDCYPFDVEKRKEQKPRIELIQRSWYMEGYTDGEFKREPMWNLVTGEGGPRYEKNEKYGQPLEQKSVNDKAFEEWIDGWYNEHHRDGYITMDEREFKNFCRGIRNIDQQKPVERTTMQDFNYHDGESDKKALNRLIAILNYAEATSDDTPVEEVQALIDWIDEKQKLQKPAEWNEEDKKRVKQLIYDTEAIRAGYEKRKELLGGRFNDQLLKDCDEQIAWLKALPERFNLQPKQEWREEDEHCIELLDTIIESSALIPKNRTKCHNFLKSLRSQPKGKWAKRLEEAQARWKPSEEQMDALHYVKQFNYGGHKAALVSLYEQLKALI